MSYGNTKVEETQSLFGRIISVALITPVLGGMLAYLVFAYFELETNSTNIKRATLFIWLATMAALGVYLVRYLRCTPNDAPETRAHATRMDWERRASRKSTVEVFKALILLPIFSLLFLFGYQYSGIHSGVEYLEPIVSNRDFRIIAATLTPLWILSIAIIAYRTRSSRIG